MGTDDIPIATDPTLGLTTSYSCDEDLTDGQGINAAYPDQFAELANQAVAFGENPNGYATAITNAVGESSITVQDGFRSNRHDHQP